MCIRDSLRIIHTQQQLRTYVDEVGGVTRWVVLRIIRKVAIKSAPSIDCLLNTWVHHVPKSRCKLLYWYTYTCTYESDTGSSAKEQNIMAEMQQNNADDNAFLHVGAQYHGASMLARVAWHYHISTKNLYSIEVSLTWPWWIWWCTGSQTVLVHLALQFTNVVPTHIQWD